MPTQESILLQQLIDTLGELEDLPSPSPRGTAIAKLKELLLQAENIPLLSILYGSSGTDQLLTLNPGEDSIFALTSDGEFLYAGAVTFPGIVIRIDLDTFTRFDSLTLNVGEDQIRKLVTDGTFLYAITFTQFGPPLIPPKVVRINLETFTIVDELDLAPFVTNNTASAVLDGTFLYVGTDDSPGRVVKIDIRNFTVVSTLTFNAGENAARGLSIDGEFLYAVTIDSPGIVVKVDLGTFLEVASITLDPGEDSETIFVHGKIIYISTFTIPVILVKVDIDTFTRIGAITLNASTAFSQGIFIDGTFVYVASATSPAQVTTVDISSFREVVTFALPVGADNPAEIFVDQTFLYIGNRTSPGQIFRKFIYPTNPAHIRRIIQIDADTSTFATYFLRPENSTGVLLTSGAGAFTKGAFSEIIAASSITTRYYLASIFLDKTTVSQQFEIDIATGLAGFETIIATVSHEVDNTNNSKEYIFTPQIKIPANTRISARCSDETGGNTVNSKVRFRVTGT